MYLCSDKSDFHLLVSFFDDFGLTLVLLNEGDFHFLVALFNDLCDFLTSGAGLLLSTDFDIFAQILVEDIPLLQLHETQFHEFHVEVRRRFLLNGLVGIIILCAVVGIPKKVRPQLVARVNLNGSLIRKTYGVM